MEISKIILVCLTAANLSAAEVFPGTTELTWTGDLAARMVRGIDTYLDRDLRTVEQRRIRHWNRDFSSAEAYEKSASTNRQELKRILGLIDERSPARLDWMSGPIPPNATRDREPQTLATVGEVRITRVRWDVLRGDRKSVV